MDLFDWNKLSELFTSSSSSKPQGEGDGFHNDMLNDLQTDVHNDDGGDNMRNDLKHVGIIMDGNSRWAKAHGLETNEGHEEGAKALKRIIPAAVQLGIKYLTVYAFSTENWKRPFSEIETILNIVSHQIGSEEELSFLNEHGVRVKVIGELDKLQERAPQVVELIKEGIDKTKDNNEMTLVIAFSYGGRQEMINACNKIISNLQDDNKENHNGMKKITENKFAEYLDLPELPDADIIIRTSGVKRLSNFLLWQSSYAELFFLEKMWPDFTEDDLRNIVKDFCMIKRNFGARK